MAAALDDPAGVHHEDDVRAADRGEAVRDHKRRAPVHDLLDGVLDEPLRDRIDGGRRLVEHKDARVGKQRAGEGQKLLLAGRKAVAALADVALIAVRQSLDDPFGGDGSDRRFDLPHGRVLAAVAEVFEHRAGEEVRRLEHIADVRVEPELAALPRVAPVDEHLPLRRLIEPADEIHERGFARAGLADDGDIRSLRHFQVEMLENVLVAVGVAEGHVFELDIAVQLLPVFLFGAERVAVLLHDLRRILHIGLCLHERGEALDVDLHVHKAGERLHEPLDRLHHALRIVHKHGERADEHHALARDDAAAPEDERERERGSERCCGNEDRAEVHRADADLFHVGGQLVEFLLHLILNDERFRRRRAGDALVEGAGDAGVFLAHLPVEEHELLLEVHGRDRHDRHDHEHAQCHLPVKDEHHNDGAHEICRMPHALGHAPGERARNAVGIGHDARVDIADAVLVEVGERKRLQMVEALALEIAADGQLQLARAEGGDIVGGRLREDDDDIRADEPAEQQSLLSILWYSRILHGSEQPPSAGC